MKNYYLDKRLFVNGRDTNFDNRFNLTSFIETIVSQSGGGAITEHTDTDGYVYKNQVGDNLNAEVLGAPNFEGYLTEIYSDANNYFIQTIYNSDNSLYGGTGAFEFGYFSVNRSNGSTNTFSQFPDETELTIQNSDTLNGLSYTSELGIDKDGRGNVRASVIDTINSTYEESNLRLDILSTEKLALRYFFNDQNTGDQNVKSLYVDGDEIGIKTDIIDSVTPFTGVMTLRMVYNNASATPLQLIYDNCPTAADNVAAVAAGMIVGSIYKTATGELRIVV